MEELSNRLQEPVNLNAATREQLRQFPFLSDIQIEHLLAYIYIHGQMETIYELQLVEDMDKQTIQYLLPFVYIKAINNEPVFRWKTMLKSAGKYGKNELLTRFDIPFYKRKGYEQTYLGPSVYNSVKYSFRYSDRLYAGVVAEKDAGEPFGALHNRYGYDYYSFYLLLKDCGRLKAFTTLIQLSYEGEFFHINDALLKGLSAQELVYAADILYNVHPSDKSLLSVANEYQHTYLPTIGGFRVARDIARGEAAPIVYRSSVFRDGRKGDEGGIAVIRSTDPKLNSALTLKATSHGLSHGHYDKLTMAYYDNGNEILTDYGASRFLNIEAKNKGHYTRENESFAKQTIAHNTLVVDETSNFDGDIKVSSRYHSDIIYSDFNGDHFQVMVAKETNAYSGVEMKRTLVYVTTPFLQFPLILDVLQANSDKEHQYDYPLWYNGHFDSLNFPYTKSSNGLQTLGTKNGYQHLWLEAWGQNEKTNTSSFTFVKDNRLYTISAATTPRTELKMLRLGANDPDFNLRNETAFLIREKEQKNHTFATSIETHGDYDVVMETSNNLTSSCEEVKVVMDTAEYTVIKAIYKGGHSVTLCLANAEDSKENKYHLSVEGKNYDWNGRCGVFAK